MKNFISFIFGLSLFCCAFAGAGETNVKSQLPASISVQENELWQEWDSPEGLSRCKEVMQREIFGSCSVSMNLKFAQLIVALPLL